MITNNLERQTELENNDLDEDLVDPAFAASDSDKYENSLYSNNGDKDYSL